MKARRSAVLGLGLTLAVGLLPAAAVSVSAAPAAPTAPAVVAPTAKLTRVPVGVIISPGSGARVGVAHPIKATFTAPVNRRRAAERAMRVYVNNNLARGAWHWKDSRTAYFRTEGFWRARATISVRVTLAGVVLATTATKKFVGGSRTTRVHTFSTARKFVARVNSDTHKMRVYVDGKLVRVAGVSLGKQGFLTRSGIKSVMEKYPTRRMTSIGAGITDPNDQYDVVATWAVRLTPTGEFVHGAPWATARIGVANGSHGCTNLTNADARWFYRRTITGDPVVTLNTGRRMEYWNGLGAPYNMPWSQWLARSATKVQAPL
jgi:lipoprotein-anchoring transpeptidase ErfK/SrfK